MVKEYYKYVQSLLVQLDDLVTLQPDSIVRDPETGDEVRLRAAVSVSQNQEETDEVTRFENSTFCRLTISCLEEPVENDDWFVRVSTFDSPWGGITISRYEEETFEIVVFSHFWLTFESDVDLETLENQLSWLLYSRRVFLSEDALFTNLGELETH